MLQKFKRNVLGVGQGKDEKTVDQKFDTAKSNYEKLSKISTELKTFATNYLTNAKGLFQNGGLVADTFHIVFNGQTHTYAKASLDHKNAMEALNKDKIRDLELRYEAGAGLRLNEMCGKFAQYKTRLEEREESRSKQDYYHAKVKKMRDDRDKRLASGKEEAAKDASTREDNEKKYEVARIKFESENTAITNELTHVWEHRMDLLGPILVEFLLIQSTVARLLSETSQVSDGSVLAMGSNKMQSWDSLMSSVENKSPPSPTNAHAMGGADDYEDHGRQQTMSAPQVVMPPSNSPTPVKSPAPAPPPPLALQSHAAPVPQSRPPPVVPAPPQTRPNPPAYAPSTTTSAPSVPTSVPPSLPTSNPPLPPLPQRKISASDAANAATYYDQNKQQVNTAASTAYDNRETIGGAVNTANNSQHTNTNTGTAPPPSSQPGQPGGANPFDWGAEF